MVQTPAATRNLSSLTWWIWYRPIASVDPVKYNDTPENLIIAASAIAAVPTIVFFLIFQRNILSGLTAGGLKG